MNPLNIIFLGAPGSGKGTRASAMSEILGVPQISTGDIFRENIKNSTPLGLEAKTFIDKGELVPDDVTASLVDTRLAMPDAQKGFILDGFPRTINQAQMLDEMLAKSNKSISYVFYIDISDDIIMERLSGRIQCSKCKSPFHTKYSPPQIANICDKCGAPLIVRDDDKPETIRHRLEVYKKTTFPLVEFYDKRKMLYNVPSDFPFNETKIRSEKFLKEINLI